MYAGNPAMDSSYAYNYGRFEDSHYYNVNGVAMHYHNPTSLGSCQIHRLLSMKEINSFKKAHSPDSWTRELQSWQILETQPIHLNATLQNMIDDEEFCGTQPIFCHVSVDTLKHFEVNEVTLVDDYWSGIEKGSQIFQIEPEIVIALDEEENEIKIDVISDKPEKPQIESEEDQPLVLVHPPTLPCTFGTPYKGVEVKEHSQIFYTTDTFVLDNLDATDSFVLEVPNEFLILKEGVHHSLPKYIDAPFVIDISKGEGIT
ncbi:hypothetical protein Scep_019884 [Stephania cephalantha]|uniref:Uncharacterized protein n=1 Tax=Stephania cephalantha TaxID=152367 RepID=A0AAP0IC10_9MAGN